jgi:hypothetical protein
MINRDRLLLMWGRVNTLSHGLAAVVSLVLELNFGISQPQGGGNHDTTNETNTTWPS